MRAELQLFSFPLSLVLAAALVVCIFLYPKKHPRILSIAVLALMAAGFAVLGCLRAVPTHRYLLAPLVLAAIFLSGVAARDGIRERRSISFILSHLGLCILLSFSFFSAPDRIDTALTIEKGKAVHLTEESMPLPFETALVEVHTEYYEGTDIAKQYKCTILTDSVTRHISVNHPALHKGWLLYLSDFDREDGSRALLRVVRDPSIPGVLLGMVLLLAGAAAGLKKSWKSRLTLPALIVLAILFTAISVSRIRFATLPPALRSFWFAPHLIVYMIAYSAMALSLVCMLLSLIPRLVRARDLAVPLMETSSALILMGIVFGSIWAQLSWGDYWAWDAKECWAAATYLLTLCAIHLPRKRSTAAYAVAMILSFATMQMTWYGVNYLPSAQDSMHTYNNR